MSGRALTVVIAILTFLACLCAGGVALLAASSAAWRDEVSREITIQILPRDGVDADAEVSRVVAIVSASPAVASVTALSRADTEKTLAPWLGAGLDLSQLPIPRLVVATLTTHDPAEIAPLRDEIESRRRAPPSTIIPCGSAISRAVGRSLTLLAALLLVLVVSAIAVAVGFATRAAMAGSARDCRGAAFRRRLRQLHHPTFPALFLPPEREGTAVGGAAAIVLFALSGLLAGRNANSPDGAAATVLLGAFHLPLGGYAAILGVCVALVAMAAVFSRIVAAAHLRALN